MVVRRGRHTEATGPPYPPWDMQTHRMPHTTAAAAAATAYQLRYGKGIDRLGQRNCTVAVPGGCPLLLLTLMRTVDREKTYTRSKRNACRQRSFSRLDADWSHG